MGEKWITYKIMVGKPEGKQLLGRPRHRWELNISIDVGEREWGSMDLIHLTQG
jgi:hypothetical protein